MKLIRDIVQGAGYLPGYGEHPGTGFLVLMIITGALAGAKSGDWLVAAVGAGLMTVVLGPLWIIGCVGRAREYQRRQG